MEEKEFLLKKTKQKHLSVVWQRHLIAITEAYPKNEKSVGLEFQAEKSKSGQPGDSFFIC